MRKIPLDASAAEPVRRSSAKIQNMERPDKTEYDPYYEHYVSLVADDDIIEKIHYVAAILKSSKYIDLE